MESLNISHYPIKRVGGYILNMLCPKRISEIEERFITASLLEEDIHYLFRVAKMAIELQEQNEMKNKLIIRMHNKKPVCNYVPST